MTINQVTGYDGKDYGCGDRVQLHSSLNRWALGTFNLESPVRGTVVGIVDTKDDQVRVELDGAGKNTFAGTAGTFKIYS